MTSRQNWKENNPNYQKEYYEKNKEWITQKKRECRAAKSEHYKAMAKKRYEEKRDIILANAARYRENNQEKIILSLAKQRAKRKDLPFNLEVSDIVIPKVCPLLGITLSQNKEGTCKDSSPSLDRLVPELGYVKGNVWVISQRANMLKNCGSLPELTMLVNNLKKKLEENS